MEDIYQFINKNTDLDNRYMATYLDLVDIIKINQFPFNILKHNTYDNAIKEINKRDIYKINKVGGTSHKIIVFTF